MIGVTAASQGRWQPNMHGFVRNEREWIERQQCAIVIL